MASTSIDCPNCGYHLANIDLGLTERPANPSSATDHPLLLRVNDAAERLGVSRTTLYGLIGKGDLRVIRIGRSIRVPWQELERLADAQV
jgi:excisionase family DNA binding protein